MQMHAWSEEIYRLNVKKVTFIKKYLFFFIFDPNVYLSIV